MESIRSAACGFIVKFSLYALIGHSSDEGIETANNARDGPEVCEDVARSIQESVIKTLFGGVRNFTGHKVNGRIRRAAERESVLQPRPRPSEAGGLDLGLQHSPATLIDRLPDPCGLRKHPA
jgi:hypothetical protein